MKKILIAGAILLSLNAHAEINADKFFNGIENGCTLSNDYQNYINSICKAKTRNGLDYCVKGSVRMPIEYEIKSVKVTDKGDYSLITTLFANDVRWHGVQVAGVVSWHGHSNGIAGTSILFDNKITPNAAKQLSAAGVTFKSRRDEVLETVGAVWNKDKKYQAAVCDWSD